MQMELFFLGGGAPFRELAGLRSGCSHCLIRFAFAQHLFPPFLIEKEIIAASKSPFSARFGGDRLIRALPGPMWMCAAVALPRIACVNAKYGMLCAIR